MHSQLPKQPTFTQTHKSLVLNNSFNLCSCVCVCVCGCAQRPGYIPAPDRLQTRRRFSHRANEAAFVTVSRLFPCVLPSRPGFTQEGSGEPSRASVLLLGEFAAFLTNPASSLAATSPLLAAFVMNEPSSRSARWCAVIPL